MAERTYHRTVSTSAAPSVPPNCAQYHVERRCYGCQRPLRISKELSLWFVGYPQNAVYGSCCFSVAAKAGT